MPGVVDPWLSKVYDRPRPDGEPTLLDRMRAAWAHPATRAATWVVLVLLAVVAIGVIILAVQLATRPS